MCGILGVISKKPWGLYPAHRKAFEDLLYMDALRGEDSTGIYTINRYGNVKWAKEAIPSYYHFTDSKDITNLLDDAVSRGTAMIGHNRKATIGGTQDAQAHPFVAGNTIMVHNGTLRNHKEFGFDHEVDSEIFCNVIDTYGFDEAVKNISGAFAVAVYDIKEKKLRLARNSERPLGIVETENSYIFASECWMAWGAAWRNNLKIEKFFELPEDNCLTFDLSADDISPVMTKMETYSFQRGNLLKKEKGPNYRNLPNVVQTTKLVWEEDEKEESKGVKPEKVGTFRLSSKEYKKGDLVCFTPEKVVSSAVGKYRIEGQHWGSDKRVVCYLQQCIKLEEAQDYIGKECLTATVKTLVEDQKTNIFTIYCEDPTENNDVETINGESLNEEQVYRLNMFCKQCKTEIDITDLEFTYVKIRNNGKMHCICPSCVDKNLEKNPKWGGLNEN